ncbi:MAG: CBS domain-containing protein [Gammaproteobacteria bacterium]|nr:CBS domain-containing protein [Gammaproteobacteria bacterium]
MSTETIMSTRLYTLSPKTTVAEAVALMIKYQVRNLPVVDEESNFVGLFGVRRLLSALLPKVMGMDLGPYSLTDLSFMPDAPTDINKHLLEIGKHPVSNYLEKKKRLVFCKPSTPLPELLELLYQNDTSLPVLIVKGKSKKLVGLVSRWDIVNKIAKEMYVPEAKKGADQENDGKEPGNQNTGEN